MNVHLLRLTTLFFLGLLLYSASSNAQTYVFKELSHDNKAPDLLSNSEKTSSESIWYTSELLRSPYEIKSDCIQNENGKLYLKLKRTDLSLVAPMPGSFPLKSVEKPETRYWDLQNSSPAWPY